METDLPTRMTASVSGKIYWDVLAGMIDRNYLEFYFGFVQSQDFAGIIIIRGLNHQIQGRFLGSMWDI